MHIAWEFFRTGGTLQLSSEVSRLSEFNTSLESLFLLSLGYAYNSCNVTGILVRNTLVTYDRENSKIGFWKTNCSELWERLHLSSDSPSAPSPSDGTKNQTKDVSPSPSPMPDKNITVPGIVAAASSINYFFCSYVIELTALLFSLLLH